MTLDPVIPGVCIVAIVVLALAVVLRRFRQPHVVAFLLAGVFIGPSGLGLVEDPVVLSRLGAMGVVLLLFFTGMEIDLPALVSRWRIAFVGTTAQVAASIGATWLLGTALDWSINRIVLLGFVISLSGTAIAIRLMQDEGRGPEDRTLQSVIGVLIVQDLAVVPMIVVLGFLGAERPGLGEIARMSLGAIVIGGMVVALARRREPVRGLPAPIAADPELRLAFAMGLCFGLALLTAALGLSTALGAFVGGLLVGASRDRGLVHETLDPFRMLLVGAFFISVGMLVDLDFVLREWRVVAMIVISALLTNTIINAGILRAAGLRIHEAVHGGALLAPLGEFSFVLAAIGFASGIIGDYSYRMTTAVIALTLTLSPAWLLLTSRIARPPRSPDPDAASPPA